MSLAETRTESMEWESLGLNVRGHPLVPYREPLEALGVVQTQEIRRLRHETRARAAGLIECLQCPPTKSGRPVWFLLVEDEFGLLQATIFRTVYERYGDLLHHHGAFLLEGRVEQDRRRGFSFLVERIGDLRGALLGAKVPSPRRYPGRGLSCARGEEAGGQASEPAATSSQLG